MESSLSRELNMLWLKEKQRWNFIRIHSEIFLIDLQLKIHSDFVKQLRLLPRLHRGHALQHTLINKLQPPEWYDQRWSNRNLVLAVTRRYENCFEKGCLRSQCLLGRPALHLIWLKILRLVTFKFKSLAPWRINSHNGLFSNVFGAESPQCAG